MPLTKFQLILARTLATNRDEESHLAGGAALNFAPNTHRYSNDLDYFHDSPERVAVAFEKDRKTLAEGGYAVEVTMNQPGFIRALVSRGKQITKIEWSHDTAWRFMPIRKDPDAGFILDPIDIAINKVLALAGRNEARDFLDVIHLHRDLLPLGALCWAATGKDPGFTPQSLLELLKRRGRYQQEDFDRLLLTKPVDLQILKKEWLLAVDQAEQFISSRPPEEIGCLYYSPSAKRFVAPKGGETDIVTHWGVRGGVLPRID